jgi:predicted urease superfamily metal-dependent hydrolase
LVPYQQQNYHLVSHIEQTGKINHHTLLAILKVLGISPDEFEKFDTKESLKPYKNAENNAADVLKEKIEHYKKENKALKDLILSQKKLIAVLESKK